MNFVLILVFSLVAAIALGFACWPLWRRTGRGRVVLVAALASLMLAVAGGAYLFVGHPALALRSLEPVRDNDLPALVSKLAWRVRAQPNDPRGWLLLGRGYLSLDDPSDAAGAFKRAVVLSPPSARPEVLSAYGEALTVAAMGAVPPEAEAAFREAYAADPKDFASRYYLGLAYAERRDVADALAMWQSLLADAPPDAPWREALLDRMALLKSQTSGPPDIAAMVQRLADRLASQPEDPLGWQRLVKAYVVLGQNDKAKIALANARKALGHDPTALAALGAEARDLRLEK